MPEMEKGAKKFGTETTDDETVKIKPTKACPPGPCPYPSRRRIVQVIRAIGVEIGDLMPGLALVESVSREIGSNEARCAKLVAVIRGVLDEEGDGECEK